MSAVIKVVVRIFFGDDEDGFSFSRTGVNISYRGTPHDTVYLRCNGQSLRPCFGVFLQVPQAPIIINIISASFCFHRECIASSINGRKFKRVPPLSKLVVLAGRRGLSLPSRPGKRVGAFILDRGFRSFRIRPGLLVLVCWAWLCWALISHSGGQIRTPNTSLNPPPARM